MNVFGRMRDAAARIRAEFRVYRLAWRHPRTPRIARWLLGLAVAYALSPVDLVPDFVPVLGHLDDVLVLTLLVTLALRRIPPDVMASCRDRAREGETGA